MAVATVTGALPALSNIPPHPVDMKASFFFSLLSASLPLVAVTPLCAQESTPWVTTTVNGAEYISLNSIQSFYKLTAVDNKGKSAQQIIRNSCFSLSVTPGERVATISGYKVRLTAPVIQDEQGVLYLSETDLVKLIDPILRPTYIAERREVKTVIIDPGHGGADTGCKIPAGNESDYTLKLALELAEALKTQGFNVVLTRSGNYYINDTQRVEIAKNTPDAIFVSLHLNTGRSDMAGVETYCAAPLMPGKRTLDCHRHDAANTALAFTLHTHLVHATQAYDRACHRAHYTLLNTLNCPAVIVIPGYASNDKEAADLSTDAYRAKMVKALTAGIVVFRDAIRPGAQITNPAPIITEPEPPVTEATPEPKPEPENKQTKPTKKTTTKSSGSSSSKKQNKKTSNNKSKSKNSSKKNKKSRKRR